MEIQSFGFIVHGNEKELRNIAELLEFSNEIPVLNSIEMEHQIRKIAAYVKANYKLELDIGKGVEYPSVADAIILLTAWQESLILVTANIRDFMLLPILSAQNEEVLLDITSNSFVNIPLSLHTSIHHDEDFRQMLNVLVHMIDKHR